MAGNQYTQYRQANQFLNFDSSIIAQKQILFIIQYFPLTDAQIFCHPQNDLQISMISIHAWQVNSQCNA